MKCKYCGMENPEGARYCGFCQQELSHVKKPRANKKGRILIAAFAVVLLVAIGFMTRRNNVPVGTSDSTNTTHAHVWIEATCEAPKTCEICGETSGFEFHVWLDATCLAPSTCRYCGLTSGRKGLHSWKSATSDTPKTCSVCGEIRGTALGDQKPAEENTADELVIALDDAIRERLPIATYAMTDEEKVYSYSDSTLKEKTEQYFFYSREDEIVILDISEDGYAMYVRYPSTISGTGYRDCWFATDDILGELEPTVSDYGADTKTKIYRRNDNDAALIYYGTIPKDTKGINMGKHTYYCNLVIHTLQDSEDILGVSVTERMGLIYLYDRTSDLSMDEYKNFSQFLEYDYGFMYPERVLTENWEGGGVKIRFLNKRELYLELTDSYMSSYPFAGSKTPLTSIKFSADQDNFTGFEVVFSACDTLIHNEYFVNSTGETDQTLVFANVQYEYSDDCIKMYIALPENIAWNLYSLTSVMVQTHLNEDVLEQHVVAQELKTTEIHIDSVRKIQSGTNFFTALDAQGNTLWTYVTPERQDRGQMNGIKIISYINDMFLFDDNGTIVALNAETGRQLWTRSDFGAVLGPWDVGVDGTIYLAGIYEPDLYVLNEQGKLLKKVKSVSEENPYVTKIHANQDHLIVGVNNYWDGWIQEYRIDLDDNSCTLLNEEYNG